ncbi:MAG: PilW family protein [Pseudomonadota bacterium]
MRNAGFTLVELMVGLAIGLLVILVIFKVATNFEGQKRTTTEGAGAQENGLYVITTLERDIRMAGWGTSATPLLGCNGTVNSVFRGAPIAGFSLMPVQITHNGTGPDTIAVTSGTGMLASTANEVTAVGASGNGTLNVASAVGFQDNDMVIVANPDGTCTFGQVTQVDTVGNAIGRGTGSNFNPAPSVRATWPAEQVGAKIYDLGNLVRRTYRLDPSDATLRSQELAAPSALSLADNIVSIKAQYGIAGADPAAQSVENWVNATGIWAAPGPAEISRIKAVRLFVVARSPIREKPDVGGACSTTAVAPKPSWADGDAVTIDLSANVQWQCFRYKSFQAIVPLRNVLWGAT